MIIDDKLLSSWSVPGHRFGECRSINNLDLVYVNIPKNASTWTKTQLATLGAQEDNYFINTELAKKPMLVMLREPIERWISGISWYMTLHHASLVDLCEQNIDVKNTVLSMIKSKVSFDPHTAPQSNFLQGINFSNTTFIRVKHNNDDYCNTFSKFFKEELGIENSFDQSPSQHVAIGNPIQLRWVNFFQSALDSDLNMKLHRYYRSDITLFNSAKFYE